MKVLTNLYMYQPKPPGYFGDISLIKAILRKNFEGDCFSHFYPQLSFKYFANLHITPKLFSKVLQVQTTLVKEISRHEWVEDLTWR